VNLIQERLNQDVLKNDEIAAQCLRSATLKPKELPKSLAGFHIFVSIVQGKLLIIECQGSDSIGMLKEKIMEKKGIRSEL
jgi:hypothetical protein